MNRAIEAGLAASSHVCEQRGILVVKDLAATYLSADDDVLEEALSVIFRALPARLLAGSVLYVTTRDRAGGDVELSWEARDEPAAEPRADALLREGPYGDLLGLAILGLAEICRTRHALAERPEPPPSGSSSVMAEEAFGKVRRRYLFLIPGRR